MDRVQNTVALVTATHTIVEQELPFVLVYYDLADNGKDFRAVHLMCSDYNLLALAQKHLTNTLKAMAQGEDEYGRPS